MAAPKILVMPGSLRTGSHNARLAAVAAKELALAEAEVTRISLEDYPLPLFDADLAASSGLPAICGAAEADVHGAPRRVHYQPRIQRLGDAAPQERDRLGVARARGQRADLCGVQGRVFALGSATRGRRRRRCARSWRCGKYWSWAAARWSFPSRFRCRAPSRRSTTMDNLKDDDVAAALKALARRLVELAGVMPRNASEDRNADRAARPPDRRARCLFGRGGAGDGGAARRRGVVLQDRLSARLRRRACLRADAARTPASRSFSISSCTTSATRSRRA